MSICIINTGGTISCVGDPLSPMSATRFAKASTRLIVPALKCEFPDVELHFDETLHFSKYDPDKPEEFPGTLDSTDIQPRDWCKIAQFILDHYADYQAFVILHGTDSMAYTGSALPFLLNVFDENGFGRAVLDKPVILTGSQTPLFAETDGAGSDLVLNFNTDAYQNVCGAVGCALTGIPEVGVYFDSHLYRGNRVLKVNADEFAAFDSPNTPPLAQYGIDLTLFPDRILPGPGQPSLSVGNPRNGLAQDQLEQITAAIDDFPVLLLPAVPAVGNSPEPSKGASAAQSVLAQMIDAICAVRQDGDPDKGLIKGLVLEAYGAGNFPRGSKLPGTKDEYDIEEALRRANESGVFIIDSTQVLSGTVDNTIYAAGAWLPGAGALSARDLTSVAAFAKTMILRAAAAGNSWSDDTVKDLIQMNLAGEMKSVDRLESRGRSALLAGEQLATLDGSAVLTNDPRIGPVLKGRDGTELWRARSRDDVGFPARLEMMSDAALMLFGRTGTEVRVSPVNLPHLSGEPSALVLSGSYDPDPAHSTVTLAIYVCGTTPTSEHRWYRREVLFG